MDRDRVVNALNILWGWASYWDTLFSLVPFLSRRPWKEQMDAIAAIKQELELD